MGIRVSLKAGFDARRERTRGAEDEESIEGDGGGGERVRSGQAFRSRSR